MGRAFVVRKSGKAISVPANVSGSVEYKLTVTSMSSALFFVFVLGMSLLKISSTL